MTTVLRVQDRSGRGPYRPGTSQYWADDSAHVGPLREMVPMKCNCGCHHGFGFADIGQLRRWFTDSELRRLHGRGYRVVEMTVDRVLAETDHQVLFCRRRPLRVEIRHVALDGPGADT